MCFVQHTRDVCGIIFLINEASIFSTRLNNQKSESSNYKRNANISETLTFFLKQETALFTLGAFVLIDRYSPISEV